MNFLRTHFIYISTWLTVAIATAFILLPGLSGGFFFDDESNIVRNEAIKINELSFDALINSTEGPTAGPLGRPVSVVSFAATHYFFGLDPYMFKAINLGLHILNGALVALLCALLLDAFKVHLSPKERAWLAIWMSAAWLIHPINILPVMLAVQRMTLLSSLFLLLALTCHLKAQRSLGNIKWLLYISSWLFFWPLAVLSKETGILFPLYVFLLSLFMPSQSEKKGWGPAFPLLVLISIVLMMLSYLGWDWLKNAYVMRPFSLAERLMTEARVLWFYAAQILLPDYSKFAIYLDHFRVSNGLFSPPTTFLSICGWTLVSSAILLYRERLPLICFAAAWFIVGHSLESSVLPLEIAQEYRNYFPSIGLLLGIGYLCVVGLRKLKLDHRKTTTVAIACFPVMALALFSGLRAEQLSHPVLGIQMEATRHPLSARANYSAALSLFKAGYGDSSDPIGGKQIQYYFEQAGSVDPSFKYGYLGLITWSCASERKTEAYWIDELALRLRTTPFSPSDYELPNEILKIMLRIPTCLNRKEALELFMKGADNPQIDGPLKAKFFEAASDYELLVSLDPRSARNLLSKATRVSPHNVQLSNKLESFDALDHMVDN